MEVFLVLALLITLYFFSRLRCPPDKLVVVEKWNKNIKVQHGGTIRKLPFLDKHYLIDLSPIKIDTKQIGETTDGKALQVSSSIVIAVDISQPETLQNAAVRLMHRTHEEIVIMADEIISGFLKLTIQKFESNKVKSEHEDVLNFFKNEVGPELAKLGLKLISIKFPQVHLS